MQHGNLISFKNIHILNPLRLQNASSIMVKGKVFTVSGAASGIGQATAVKLAQLGASGISISDINFEALQETKDTCILCYPYFVGSLG